MCLLPELRTGRITGRKPGAVCLPRWASQCWSLGSTLTLKGIWLVPSLPTVGLTTPIPFKGLSRNRSPPYPLPLEPGGQIPRSRHTPSFNTKGKKIRVVSVGEMSRESQTHFLPFGEEAQAAWAAVLATLHCFPGPGNWPPKPPTPALQILDETCRDLWKGWTVRNYLGPDEDPSIKGKH